MNKEHGQKIINSNNYRVLVQVAFWIVILGTMSLLVLGFDAPRDFYFRNILQIISALIIVLINSLLLLPHFFARKKYKQYFLWITMAIILLTCINVINESKFLDLQPPDAKIEMKDRPKHGLIDIKYLINFLLLAELLSNESLSNDLQSQLKPHKAALSAVRWK